jgi:hypothetical protein
VAVEGGEKRDRGMLNSGSLLGELHRAVSLWLVNTDEVLRSKHCIVRHLPSDPVGGYMRIGSVPRQW